MLTASHLGVGHTGFKAVIDGVPPSQEQMKDIAAIVDDIEVVSVAAKKKGSLIALTELYDDYIAKIKELVLPLNKPTRYNFVFDVSNGPNAHVIDKIASYLQLDYALINSEIKSENLAHDTNPKIQENRAQLVSEVKKLAAEIGIIWDGDGDRAYFVDSTGEIIAPEFVGSVIGKYLIKNKKGTTITLDVRGSAAVEKELSAVAGNVLRIQAWHVPIKFEMERDPDIVFGMETSGHYVFRDMFKADDGLLASLMFIKALDEEETDLSILLHEFRSKYKIVEEINFETPKSEEQLVGEFKQLYPEAKVIDIDGVTVEFPDWRFNIRSSRTEPIIRLNISGSNFEKVDENLKLLITQIGGRIL